MPVKTRTAARQLGCAYFQLIYLINIDRLEPPNKDESGDYVWMPEDIDRARTALTEWREKRIAKVTSHLA